MSRKITLIIVLFLGAALGWLLAKNTQIPGFVNNRAPVPTESQDISDNWNVYFSFLRYKISYPDGYVIQPNGDYSIWIFKPLDEPGAGPFNFIYVSLVQPNMIDNEGQIYNYNPTQFKKLQGLKVGESISLGDTQPPNPNLDKWFTYTRVDDAEIDGHIAKRFENNNPWEFPGGTTEVRYIFESGGYIYILGYYYSGKGVTNPIDDREAFRTVSSFHINKQL